MSPEQITEDYITYQSDLFSLGVVMYELLTGRHPFAADNFSRLIHRIINEAQPPLHENRRDIPQALERIVCKSLQKDCAQRYGRGEELALDLSLAFNHLELSKREISTQEKFIALKKLEFFQGLLDPELSEILRIGVWQYYEKNTEILAESRLEDCFVLIISGEITIRKGGEDSLILKRGDCFGEMGHRNKPKSPVTIRAKDRVCLLKVNSTLLNQVSLNCQARFLKAFLTGLVHRLSTAQSQDQGILIDSVD
jgi:eukaryotic-like serine/threonine-protein kinase